jgi:RHS repeat-associated protein
LKTLQDAGGTTTYNYGPSNLLDSMQAPGDASATTYTYTDDNQRKTTTYPNGVVITATWEDGSSGNEGPGRLKRIKAVKGATTISDFTYSYLNGGVDTTLRQSVTNKNNATTSYSYDALNRLKTATNVNGVDNYTYTYDGNGNMTSRLKNATTTSYGYNDANELCWNGGGAQSSSACSPVPTGMTTWTYDGAGEALTASTAFSASYNARQQTTSMNTIVGGAQVPFTYAGTNQFERATAGSTSFVHTALGLGAETTGTSATYYRRDNDGGLASERLPSGATYYYVFDGLGSVVAVTDSAGTAQDTYTYDPYGGTAVTGTVPNPWRYASTYQDSTGFYKMGMRYYNTLIQRWTQQDPKEQPREPRQADRYAHAGDDPINGTDPTGRDIFDTILEYEQWRESQLNSAPGNPLSGAQTGCQYGLPIGLAAGSAVDEPVAGGWIVCGAGAVIGAALAL